YGPVLRRIAILAAVIVMVPAMLWVITNFMRTYVAQPVIASPKSMLAATTTGSIDTGSTAASSHPANPVVEARATATDSNPLALTAKVASPDAAASPAGGAPQPSPNTSAAQPAGNWPAANAASNAPANNGPWPDPSQAV